MSQQNSYLESKVLTASPQQLHLMLIEGAIRFGRHSRVQLEQGNIVAADEPLERMLDIVEELLVGVRGKKSEINIKLAELYLFVFRRLAETKLEGDVAKLNEALGVLEYERETWQMACEQAEAEQQSQDQEVHKTAAAHRHSNQPSQALLAPHLPQSGASQLSLEA